MELGRRRPPPRRNPIGRLLATPRGRREALYGAATAIGVAVLIVILIGRGGGTEYGDAAKLAGEVPGPVRDSVRKMSAQQKVDQVLALGFEGTDGTSPVIAELRERQLGAVFVAGRNWTGKAQGKALISELRSAGRRGGRIPPVVMATQEGGEYRSFEDLPPDATELQVGDLGSFAAAEEWGAETATALKRTGIDLALFPAADVAPLESPLSDRAFSDDHEIAASLTLAAIRGCERARMACAPGRFPGLGAASQDTDEGPATVGLDEAMIEERDLRPFRAAVEEEAPAIVLSHAFYAAYDAVTPASLSPAIATTLLRGELEFEGVAITDDLAAGAIRSGYSVANAAVEAVSAGADLVLIGEPGREQERARALLLSAARTGKVSQDRLDAAAGHVLELKRRLGLLRM
jgi:beta-N-acetylhexosaminidase